MPEVSEALDRLYATLLRARMPVLWALVAITAAAVIWYIEDPLLSRP